MCFIKSNSKYFKKLKKGKIIAISCGVIGGASVALAIALPLTLIKNERHVKLNNLADIDYYL
jgi:NhaP-type Na+/H+ or K+/H+ antiporter